MEWKYRFLFIYVVSFGWIFITRSYYRCTTATCNVKKRVERSFTDPSVVVTTYEGQHTHPSPLIPRPSVAGVPPVTAVGSSFAMPLMQGSILPSYPRHHHHQQQQQDQQPFVNNSFLPVNLGCNVAGLTGCSSATNGGFLHEKRFYNCTPGASLLKDHGLLEDIVPSHMLKEN